MILAHATWPDVEAFDRNGVVVIPTGSLEQHGRHLPLFTDSLIVGAVARAVEAKIPDQVLLAPPLWLGASGHHTAFAGTLSASFESYMGAINSVVESLIPHGFRKFFVLNGHGGNTEPNGVVLRSLKAKNPSLTFGHSSYFAYVSDKVRESLEGPVKEMRHACEAEVSLGLHLFPELVRQDMLCDDGLRSTPEIRGLIHHFDEVSEDGSLGYGSLGTAEKGELIFNLAVEAITHDMSALAAGYVLEGPLVVLR